MSFKDFLLYLIFVILVIFTLSRSAYSQEPIPAKQAIRAIVGEASGEGWCGMYLIACGIRNRKTLSGVNGLKAPHVDNQPEWVWLLAKNAWEFSKDNSIHTGDHWGSKVCDKKWIKRMESKGFVKAYDYKGHIFYEGAK